MKIAIKKNFYFQFFFAIFKTQYWILLYVVRIIKKWMIEW